MFRLPFGGHASDATHGYVQKYGLRYFCKSRWLCVGVQIELANQWDSVTRLWVDLPQKNNLSEVTEMFKKMFTVHFKKGTLKIIMYSKLYLL